MGHEALLFSGGARGKRERGVRGLAFAQLGQQRFEDVVRTGLRIDDLAQDAAKGVHLGHGEAIDQARSHFFPDGLSHAERGAMPERATRDAYRQYLKYQFS